MIMKRLISFFLIISVLVHYSCTKKNNNFEPISIIPQPVKVEPTGGTFNLNANTKLVFPEDESIRQIAGLLSGWIKIPTGFDLPAGEMGSERM